MFQSLYPNLFTLLFVTAYYLFPLTQQKSFGMGAPSLASSSSSLLVAAVVVPVVGVVVVGCFVAVDADGFVPH